MGAKFISALGKKNRIIYDLKYLFSKKNPREKSITCGEKNLFVIYQTRLRALTKS